MLNFELSLQSQFEKRKQKDTINLLCDKLLRSQRLTPEGEDAINKLRETTHLLVDQYFTHKAVISGLVKKELGLEMNKV